MRRVLVVTAFLICFGAPAAEASSPRQQPIQGDPAQKLESAAQTVEAQPQAAARHSRRKLDLSLPQRGQLIPAAAGRNPQGTTGQGPSTKGSDFDPWFPGRGLGVKVTTTW